MVTLVRQRSDYDCGPASLAMLAPDLSYDAIMRAVAKVEPRWQGRTGLHNRELIALADTFGIRLTSKRRYEVSSDTGILRTRGDRQSARGRAFPAGHFVVLYGGRIFDPWTGRVTDWRTYAIRHGARLGTLLRVEPY